jgi:hypothetical protein
MHSPSDCADGLKLEVGRVESGKKLPIDARNRRNLAVADYFKFLLKCGIQ